MKLSEYTPYRLQYLYPRILFVRLQYSSRSTDSKPSHFLENINIKMTVAAPRRCSLRANNLDEHATCRDYLLYNGCI
jgi:hypothetical protein